MIVVAIIGILAAIAIPNFLRFQLKAKSSEGKTNIAAIRTAEESYFAEYGGYVSADPSPNVMTSNAKNNFVNAMGPGAGFDQIGWSPEGEVYFTYSVAVPATVDEFTVAAIADIDNDDVVQAWGYKKGAEPAKAHPDGVCDETNLTPETVEPCDPSFGQSIF